MKATNKTELVLGNSEIEVNIYSAIESETSFTSLSGCCNSPINFKRVCSNCAKEVEFSQLKKAIKVGDEYKEVNKEAIKLETTSFRILGTIEDLEENGIFKNGEVWFIGLTEDKKNKGKTDRNNLKFSYLRESLRNSNVNLIGLINLRGKEHIVILKPYFNAFVGLGLYHFNRVRDVKEVSAYGLSCSLDNSIILQMSEQIKLKEKIAIKNIENTRDKILSNALTSVSPTAEKVEENPLTLCSF
jgi:DNA end-binding protein Ku